MAKEWLCPKQTGMRLVTFRDMVDGILRKLHQEVKADSDHKERDQLIKVV